MSSSSLYTLTSRLMQAAPEASAALIEDETDKLANFSAIMSNILLFFLIFGLTATVQVQDLKHQLTNKFAIGAGVTMQFVFMPFLGFCAVVLLKNTGFTEAMGLSLLVVTASPGGSYSNWWCSLFNAELALSVAMTSVSSILSLGLLPANLFFYSWLAYTVVLDTDGVGSDIDVIGVLDFNAIFITLGVVLGAIIFGLYVGYKYDNVHFHKRANQFGSLCGILLILFSVFLGSGGGDADTNFWSLPWSFYVGTAFPCILGMALANIISRGFRLSPPEVVAISIECCYQNTAIATSVAVTMFTDPDERAEAVSVPLFYGITEAIIIGIYCLWAWKMGWTKAPADEKLCVVMTETYESAAHESDEDIWDGELPKGWFKRLFVPKDVERQHASDESREGDSKKQAKGDEGPRDRFESADVTVATSLATPPSTPESSFPRESAIDSVLEGDTADLEMQSPRKGSLMYHSYRIDEDPDGYPTDEHHSPPTSHPDLSQAIAPPSVADEDETSNQNAKEIHNGPVLPAGPSKRDLIPKNIEPHKGQERSE